MNYKSISDLARDIRRHLHKVPEETDLIVGIPRSGLLAACLLGTQLNLPVIDLESFIEDRPIQAGDTYELSQRPLRRPSEARCPLIFDDSYATGSAHAKVRQRLAAAFGDRCFCFGVVYTAPGCEVAVDLYFEIVAYPRFFEWNLMKHPQLAECCVDIDGVLCLDPLAHENDDGPAYLAFLASATRLARPTQEIGHLVTSRLEKYRPETVAWLARHGIRHRHLHMLNLPSAAERRRLQAHGSFKAEVYRSLPASRLFIESEPAQATEIARLSGKEVLCFTTQELVRPELSLQRIKAHVHGRGYRALQRLKHKLWGRR